MATRRTEPMSFWQRLSGGPWGESVAQRIEAALDEFVRRLRHEAVVSAILVFGSYARGDFGRKSDLDLLVLLRPLSPNERAGAERRVAHAAVEVESAHRLPVHLAPLIAEAGKPEELSSALLHEILTDGIVLFGQTSALASLQPGSLAPWNVVRFSLQGTPARERVRLACRLHGTKTRPGIIRLPGLNLARGAAFLPVDQTRAVRAALEEAGAAFDIVPVWREVITGNGTARLSRVPSSYLVVSGRAAFLHCWRQMDQPTPSHCRQTVGS